MTKEKVFSLKKWFKPAIGLGLRKVWIPLLKYLIIVGVSFSCFTFLSSYDLVTKWIVFGLWAVLTIISIILYVKLVEYYFYELPKKCNVELYKDIYKEISYEKAIEFEKLTTKEKNKKILINMFLGVIIFDLITIIAVCYLLFFSGFEFLYLAKLSLTIELVVAIILNVIYLLLAYKNSKENPKTPILWKKCPKCGGVMKYTTKNAIHYVTEIYKTITPGSSYNTINVRNVTNSITRGTSVEYSIERHEKKAEIEKRQETYCTVADYHGICSKCQYQDNGKFRGPASGGKTAVLNKELKLQIDAIPDFNKYICTKNN